MLALPLQSFLLDEEITLWKSALWKEIRAFLSFFFSHSKTPHAFGLTFNKLVPVQPYWQLCFAGHVGKTSTAQRSNQVKNKCLRAVCSLASPNWINIALISTKLCCNRLQRSYLGTELCIVVQRLCFIEKKVIYLLCRIKKKKKKMTWHHKCFISWMHIIRFT